MGSEIEHQPPLDATSSRSFHLEHGEKIARGIKRVAGGRTERVLEELRNGNGDGRAAAIHTARKDLKKLRAVLRLVRAELGEDLFARENARYRTAGRALSESRDAAVKVETLAGLDTHFGTELPSTSTSDWRRQLERERDTMPLAGGPDADPEAALKAVEAGQKAIAEWPLKGDSWRLLGVGIRRNYAHGSKAMKRAASDPDPERVHEWRKRSKDLWYQLRLIQKAWPALLGVTIERTHELTDLLGDHHDLTVLAEDLKTREDISRRDALEAAIGRRQKELLDDALALGRRLYAEKPKAFEKRMRSYWAVWR